MLLFTHLLRRGVHFLYIVLRCKGTNLFYSNKIFNVFFHFAVIKRKNGNNNTSRKSIMEENTKNLDFCAHLFARGVHFSYICK